MFEKDLSLLKNDIIKDVVEVCKFKSISKEDNDYPFGSECNKALEYVLDIGRKFGFKVKNIDGYCGYIECGEGEELIGIIGHLDVVPANIQDGWKTDPFNPIIEEGKIFARGTIDDKGPVIASLYAMKLLSDNVKLNKRIRLILGLNEEVDWKCIERYKKTEEIPQISFSPDADFPCIYAEKMILSVKIATDFELPYKAKIVEFNDYNNAINVVPKHASLIFKTDNEEFIKKIKLQKEKIQLQQISENTFRLDSFGVQSHAAHPENGENAITNLLKAIPTNSLIEYLDEIGFFSTHSPKYLGDKNTEDESGQLTSNIAKINYTQNGKLELSLNLRVPINTKFETIKDYYSKLENINVEYLSKQDGLYVSKDSYLVKTLTKIFNEEVNGNFEPIAIGGGTYARAFNNCVSFGMNMPGDKDMCHQVNEFVEIDKLLLSTKIYAKALNELLK